MYAFCFLVLVSLSAVSEAGNICCLESEYSVHEGGNGIVKVGEKSMLLSFQCRAVVSYPQQRTGADCVEYSPTNLGFRLIQDYKEGVMYLIEKENGTCTKQPLEGKLFEQCLPDTLKPLNDFYFGRMESEHLSASVYEIRKGVYATINAADKKCDLLGATLIGQENVELETVGYFNYTKGIEDESLLKIPPSCNKDLPLKAKMNPDIWDMNTHRWNKYYSLL